MKDKELWYIDALDARAGQAFAAVRRPDLKDSNIDLGVPGVFVGPPTFQAETVSSRAVGFAATQGCFQLGLFDDNEEIGFGSLQLLVAFVRRAYMSSGGGDGGSGIGPLPPPVPPERPAGDPIRLDVRKWPPERSAIGLLLQRADRFQNMAEASSRAIEGVAHVEWWSDGELTRTRGPTDYDVLTRAVALLVDSLLRRFHRPQTKSFQPWQDACSRLGMVIDRFALWPFLLTDSGVSPVRDLAHRIVRAVPELRNSVQYRTRDRKSAGALALIALLGGYWQHRFHPYYWDDFYREVLRRGASVGQLTMHTPLDSIDTLSVLPLPDRIVRHLKLDPRSASVRDLLCIIVASPGLMIRSVDGNLNTSSDLSTDIVAILLLAAAHIVGVDRRPYSDASRSLLEQFSHDLISEAMKWLRMQLPSGAFPAPIESIISSTAALRYAD